MFRIISEDPDTLARVGSLNAGRKKVKTPFFMPVATKGSVKYLDSVRLKETGISAIISNSLIFSLKPGLEAIKKAGGIHNYISWDRFIFTDSGGFQSLDKNFLVHTTSDHALFKSPFDGLQHEITPEKAMDIQLTLGSDVAMCLDEVPLHDDPERTVRSKTLRTHSWAKRCLAYHEQERKNHGQLLFGIAQGGNYLSMRKKSVEFISKQGFDGIAQGGLAIGEPVEKMYKVLHATCPLMPKDKPRYLMGVGNPIDIVEAVSMGVDCFDSTFPTQNARHGTLFTFDGILRITQENYAEDFTAIEEGCDCAACRNYSRAFIRHQIRHKEGTGLILATIHNIRFMQRLMEKIQASIEEQQFSRFKEQFRQVWKRKLY